MHDRKIKRHILTACILLLVGCNSAPKQSKKVMWETAPWTLQQDTKPITSQPHTFLNFTNL